MSKLYVYFDFQSASPDVHRASVGRIYDNPAISFLEILDYGKTLLRTGEKLSGIRLYYEDEILIVAEPKNG